MNTEQTQGNGSIEESEEDGIPSGGTSIDEEIHPDFAGVGNLAPHEGKNGSKAYF